MTYQSIYTEEMVLFFLLFCGMLFSSIRTWKPKIQHGLFGIYIVYILLTVVDAIWVQIDGNIAFITLNRVLNTIYLILTTSVGYMWFVYVCGKISNEMRPNKHLIRISGILSLLVSIWIIFLLNTNLFFGIDESGSYYRGKWLILITVPSYLFMLIASILSVLSAFKEKDSLKKKTDFANAFFVIPAFLGNVIQIFIPQGLQLSYFGAIVSMFILLVVDTEVLISKREAKESRRNAITAVLSNTYDFVCYISLKENNINVFRSAGIFESLWKVDENRSQKISSDRFDSILLQLIPKGNRANFIRTINRDNLMQVIQEKGHTFVEVPLEVLDQIQWYRFVFVQDQHSGNVVLGIRNVDIEKQAEMKLVEAKKVAEQANASKSAFLFNMSHDIRTPLNAVLGFHNLAKKYISDEERAVEYLRKADVSARHLLKLINDVLDISSIEKGNIFIEEDEGSISEIPKYLYTFLGNSAEASDLKLEITCSNIRNDKVWADKLHINQILINIISNSIKYSKEKGHIWVTITQIEDKKPGYASYQIVVRDDGIGIHEEFLDRICEPFERDVDVQKSKIMGTGLGMAITKKLVDALEGTIEVESEVDVGTTTRLYFDFRIREDEKKIIKSASDKKVNLLGKRILLVEDNEFNMEITKEILEESGMLVDTAEDGEIAVKKVKECKKNDLYDLILMDVQMPNMNGYEATKAIRKIKDPIKSKLPIIAMTANAFAADRKEAIDAGMNEHMAKPIEADKMIMIICDII